MSREEGPPVLVVACLPTMGGMAFERITVDPERMDGVPCIRDLRVTVTMVLGQLAAGRTVEQLLADYPCLEAEDVRAAPA